MFCGILHLVSRILVNLGGVCYLSARTGLSSRLCCPFIHVRVKRLIVGHTSYQSSTPRLDCLLLFLLCIFLSVQRAKPSLKWGSIQIYLLICKSVRIVSAMYPLRRQETNQWLRLWRRGSARTPVPRGT